MSSEYQRYSNELYAFLPRLVDFVVTTKHECRSKFSNHSSAQAHSTHVNIRISSNTWTAERPCSMNLITFLKAVGNRSFSFPMELAEYTLNVVVLSPSFS